MLAAEAAFDALAAGRSGDELAAYPAAFEKSWLHDELHRARNFKPYLDKGLATGAVLWGIDQIVFRGKAPWTLHRSQADYEKLYRESIEQPDTFWARQAGAGSRRCNSAARSAPAWSRS